MNTSYHCNNKNNSRQPYKPIRTLLKRFIKREAIQDRNSTTYFIFQLCKFTVPNQDRHTLLQDKDQQNGILAALSQRQAGNLPYRTLQLIYWIFGHTTGTLIHFFSDLTTHQKPNYCATLWTPSLSATGRSLRSYYCLSFSTAHVISQNRLQIISIYLFL